MANFARLDSNNIVIQTIIVSDKDCLDNIGNFSEEVGIEFCKTICGQDTNWKQVSSLGGVGYTYDETLNSFIPPKPFASWVLDEATCHWKAPVDMPADDKRYSWDEATTSWIEVV
jgi:hypothetical protein